jgi:hypothetical protein
MKNKSMKGIQSRKILLIFVMTAVALPVSKSSQMHMVSASVEGGTSDSNASDVMHLKQHKDNPTQLPINQEEAVNHINEAQSALQNGDTAGAQMHMDLAKKVLTPCNPGDPHC